MFTGDLTSEQGRQDYENYIMNNVRNEINSYTKQSQSNAVSSVGSVVFPSGIILSFAGGPGVIPDPGTRQDVPDGWLLCSGLAVSRVAYSGLFTIIGTTYGVGDGSTTFNVPDLRGRAPHGKDNMGGTAINRVTASSGITGTTLGAAGGTEVHTLTTAQMPSHTHRIAFGVDSPITANNIYNPGASGATLAFSSYGAYGFATGGGNDGNAYYSGGGALHQNMSPTIITNYIIKT